MESTKISSYPKSMQVICGACLHLFDFVHLILILQALTFCVGWEYYQLHLQPKKEAGVGSLYWFSSLCCLATQEFSYVTA